MNLNAYGTRLTALTKELSMHWDQTKDVWKDSRSAEFEKKYIEELLASVDKASAVIAQLDKVINRVRHDCE